MGDMKSKGKSKVILIHPRTRSSIRLDEWRRSPTLITAAQSILALKEMRSMLDVLYGESPANYQLAILGIRAEDRAALQAKTEGYHMCLDFLESLGMPIEDDKPPIEATFEPPEPIS
jgi:hypothetical protein